MDDTFISQREHGRGRIPPDCYLVWAKALAVQPRKFVFNLMSYYEPVTYDILFGADSRPDPLASKPVTGRFSRGVSKMPRRRIEVI